MPSDAYLGNSVYARFDGYRVILEVTCRERQAHIELDPPAVQALIAFNREMWTGDRPPFA